jgi:hypothetical protein
MSTSDSFYEMQINLNVNYVIVGANCHNLVCALSLFFSAMLAMTEDAGASSPKCMSSENQLSSSSQKVSVCNQQQMRPSTRFTIDSILENTSPSTDVIKTKDELFDDDAVMTSASSAPNVLVKASGAIEGGHPAKTSELLSSRQDQQSVDSETEDFHPTAVVNYQRTGSQQAPARDDDRNDAVTPRESQVAVSRGNQCSSLLARAAEAFHRRHVSERLQHQQIAELRAFSDLLLAQMQYQYQNHYHHRHHHHHQQQQQQWKVHGGQRHQMSQQYSHRNSHMQPIMQCSGHFRSDDQLGRFPFTDASDMTCTADCRRIPVDCQRLVSEMTSPEIGCVDGRRMHHDEQIDVCSSDSLKPTTMTAAAETSEKFETDMRSTSPQYQHRAVQQPTSTTVTINDCGVFREESNDDEMATCSRLDDNDEISVDEDDDALYYTQDDNNGDDADDGQNKYETNDFGKWNLFF